MDPQAPPQEPQERHVSVPSAVPSPFPPNKITTSKYTYWSFLPKNLWEQFHKVANIYFLCNAVLQAVPMISVSNGIPNVLLPLVFVLTVSAVKDFLEDFKRRQSDKEENLKVVDIVAGEGWKSVSWQELKVGDVVRVVEDQYFPADIVLLSSSDESGFAYVETKNIDGETNLKHKLALQDLNTAYREDNQLQSFRCEINCDPPNSKIYTFQGNMRVGEVLYPLDQSQALLRGSSLKNTKWVIGVVVYSGHDTKLMQNSVAVRFKYSRVEDEMSKQIVYVIFLQVFLCFLCAAYYTLWFWLTEDDTEQYLDLDSHNDKLLAQFIITFFSWMLIFTNFVPISLIVTLEMVKYFQAYFISWDLALYHEETDTPAAVQSSNLNEELGQITHIFTDKTGTLTCNIMEFRKFSVLGVSYGSSQRTPSESKKPFVDFVHPGFDRTEEVKDFLWVLAICHTVFAETTDTGEVVYKAVSPDELALVEGAKYFGVRFLSRSRDDEITLEIDGVIEQVKLLQVLEFTSDRKRMSVIVRTADGRIRLLCKGADTVLRTRIAIDTHLDDTEKHLEDFANEGLRTLMFADREWTEEEYEDWRKRWVEALDAIADREALKSALADEAEQNLRLVGATAIEDRLQDGVPTTIAALRRAGIRVWMLTGDKIETAVNIGYSCALLSPNMGRITIDGTTKKEVRQQIANARHLVKLKADTACALVISGESLETIQNDSLKDFVKIAEKCESVLCCRVSPQQKAILVDSMVKYLPGIRALAVGDGANDVNMITAAHVGVGIAGLEGTQAVRASDFSISQFRFLQRLLFVHGHECYRRNATLICYNFYKNMLLVLPLFWYGMVSAFSGNILYNMWTYNFYNMFYCFFPIFVYALFDKERDYKELEETPKYYRVGMRQELFNTQVFWQEIGEAALKSVFICFITFLSMCYYTGDRHEGKDPNIWQGAITMYFAIVVIANLRILSFSYSVTWFSILIMLASVGMFFFTHFLITEWLPISEWMDNYDMKGATFKLFSNPNMYNAVVVLMAISFVFYPVAKYLEELVVVFRKREMAGQPQADGDTDEDEDDDSLLADKDRFSRYTGVVSRRYTGFAFSQEAGHTPQITDPLVRL